MDSDLMETLKELAENDLRYGCYFQQAAEEIERLQAENAELKKDAAIGAVVWKFIDRMNDVAPECGDSAERILSEFVEAVMPAFDAAFGRMES